MVTFHLDGNTLPWINFVALSSLAAVFLSVVGGVLIKRSRIGEPVWARLGMPPWGVCLLALSYGFLFPGIYAVLFSFNIMLDFTFLEFGLGDGGGLNKAPPTTESMMSLVGLLRNTGSQLGAYAVILYAMVVPAVKAAMLVIGLVLKVRQPEVSAACIHFVQSISKWACPDMFAYILLTYLVRGLDNTPIKADMKLDVGFTCFSIFCVASTVASLGIEGPSTSKLRPCTLTSVLPRRIASGTGLAIVTAVLVTLFLFFLLSGLCEPVMALRIKLDSMYKPHGPIPDEIMGFKVKPIIDNLRIPEKAADDVSLLQASTALLSWTTRLGEVNSFIALVLLSVFAIGFTILDVSALALAACLLHAGSDHSNIAKYSRVLRKLSMLDVLVMGVIVVVLCMSMYQKVGIFVTMRRGVAHLFAAEVLHACLFFLVQDACSKDQLLRDEVARPELEEMLQPQEGI